MTTFRPDATRTSLALRHLVDPECTFAQAALNLGTTLEALAAWMTLPNVRSLLQQIEQAAIERARLISATLLPIAAAAAQRLLNSPEAILPPTATPDQSRRAHETLRRAGNFMLRLTRLRGPGDAPPTPTPRPRATTTGTRPEPNPAPRTIKAFDDPHEGPATLSRYLGASPTDPPGHHSSTRQRWPLSPAAP